MNSNSVISDMQAADYDQVHALWLRTEGLSRLETRDELNRYLERNPGLSQVASCDGRIVGAVLCGHDGRRGYLYHLAVERAHRGQGLARRLVARCLERLAEAGIGRCSLQVYSANESGREFWKRLGWTARTDVLPFTIDLVT